MSSSSPQYRYNPEQFQQVFEHSFGYLAGVRRNSQRFASRPALHDPVSGRRWTYAQLWEDTGRLAAGPPRARCPRRGRDRLRPPERPRVRARLDRRAAPRRDRDADQLPAGRGRGRARARRQPAEGLHPRLEPRHGRRRGAVAGRPPPVPGRRRRPPRTGRQPVAAAIAFSEIFADASADVPPEPDRSIYAETTRLYTSGTTGLPKGVSLPDIVEVLSAHDVIMHFPLTPEDRTLNMTPWFHRGGLYSGGPEPGLLRRRRGRTAAHLRRGHRARLGRRSTGSRS